jgi:tellurite resistance protein TerC
MDISMWGWIGFTAFVVGMLALDLFVFHRKSHEVKLREALAWSGVWIALALAFNLGLYFWGGSKPAMEFLTGYLIEKSLSVDNVFIFAVLFAAFRVPKHCEHKILFWGVFGALVMRAAMIFAGVALINRFHWLIYVFGAFLVLTGLKMLRPNLKPADPEKHWVIRLCRRLFRVTDRYHDDRFVIRDNGKLWATPLLLVLLMVETTDLIFAVDSIPAILAVSSDPFIVFTSNVFAMLGLRALYFALAGMMNKFRYLNFGLAGILASVGVKMMLVDVAPIPVGVSLTVVAGILAVAMIASLLRAASTTAAESLAAANEAEPVLCRAVPERFSCSREQLTCESHSIV